MNLRRGWWISGIVAVAALLAAWPTLADEGYVSNADGDLVPVDLVTYAASGIGGPADPSPRTAGCCDAGVIGYVEYLYMGAHRDGMDVAQITNNPAEAVFNTSILEAQYGRDSGVRVGLGYQFVNCWDVAWNYTYFFTDGATGLSITENDHTTVMAQQLMFPLIIGEGYLEAYSRLRYHVNDLELGRWIRLDDSASLRLFGGFRWAIIDQSLTQAYQTVSGENVFSGTNLRLVNMDGYGIRLGTEGRMNRPAGFSLFGRTAASVLAGHFSYATSQAHSVLTVPSQGTLILTLNENTTQAVPVLEAAVGAAWTYNQIELSAGYELSCWFNMGNRYTLSRYSPTPVPPVSNDLLLDGFFVRAAYCR